MAGLPSEVHSTLSPGREEQITRLTWIVPGFQVTGVVYPNSASGPRNGAITADCTALAALGQRLTLCDNVALMLEYEAV